MEIASFGEYSTFLEHSHLFACSTKPRQQTTLVLGEERNCKHATVVSEITMHQSDFQLRGKSHLPQKKKLFFTLSTVLLSPVYWHNAHFKSYQRTDDISKKCATKY
jgi:hypothetical protein